MSNTMKPTEAGYSKKILITLCERQSRRYMEETFKTQSMGEKVLMWHYLPDEDRISFIIRVWMYGSDDRLYRMAVVGTATDYAGISCHTIEDEQGKIVWSASVDGRKYLDIKEPYLDPERKIKAKHFSKVGE